MDRALQFVVVSMAAATAAQGAIPWAKAESADSSGIIFAQRPAATVNMPTPASNPADRPAALGSATGTPFGLPTFSPESPSSYISSLIANSLPKFNPLFKSTDLLAASSNSTRQAVQVSPEMAFPPAFYTWKSKIPDEDQILTFKGKAEIAMDRYLGPSDGLDRGVLNRYSLAQLWKKIPILGALDFVGTPGEMSNEDRAFDAGGANDNIPYPHPPPKLRDGS
jgi:hypothetical protein